MHKGGIPIFLSSRSFVYLDSKVRSKTNNTIKDHILHVLVSSLSLVMPQRPRPRNYRRRQQDSDEEEHEDVAGGGAKGEDQETEEDAVR